MDSLPLRVRSAIVADALGLPQAAGPLRASWPFRVRSAIVVLDLFISLCLPVLLFEIGSLLFPVSSLLISISVSAAHERTRSLSPFLPAAFFSALSRPPAAHERTQSGSECAESFLLFFHSFLLSFCFLSFFCFPSYRFGMWRESFISRISSRLSKSLKESEISFFFSLW